MKTALRLVATKKVLFAIPNMLIATLWFSI